MVAYYGVVLVVVVVVVLLSLVLDIFLGFCWRDDASHDPKPLASTAWKVVSHVIDV
jgi:hypothetical protein